MTAYGGLEIRAGALVQDLAGRVTDEHGCRVYATTDTTFGNPDPITAELTSLLRDGSSVTRERWGNRVASVGLVVEGPSLGAIARTEERLQRGFAGVPALLRWQPDDPSAALCVFEVTFSVLPHLFDGAEGRWRRRVFAWELTAMPFARAEHATVITLPVNPVAPTVLDDGSVLSRWLVEAGGATGPVAGSGGVEFTFPASLESFLSVNFPDVGPLNTYDYISVSSVGLAPPSVMEPWSGEVLPLVSRRPTGDDEWVSIYGPHRDSPIHGFTWIGIGRPSERWYRADPRDESPGVVVIREVAIVGAPEEGRQALIDFPVGGSAPTYGEIRVTTDGALGDVLVHTTNTTSAGTPPWSGHIVGGPDRAPEVPDVSSPSGIGYQLRDEDNFYVLRAEFPAAQFDDGAAAALWVIARNSQTFLGSAKSRLDWEVQSVSEDVPVGEPIKGSVYHDFAPQSAWNLIPLGTAAVPPTRVGDGGSVRVTVRQASGFEGNVFVGDGYLLTVGEGSATTVVRAADSHTLRITAPTVDDRTGGVWVSTNGAASEYHAGHAVVAGAHRPHVFEPGGSRVWLLTASNQATLEVEFYRRWHDHVTVPDGSSA